MQALNQKLKEKVPVKFKPKNYRLNIDGFYYKLCPSRQYDVNGTEMIRGMYLPLEYFDGLLSLSDNTGPLGGPIVTYDNARRHLNNSVFIHLVQNGWIGTRGAGSNAFAEIVGNSIRNGSEVIYGDYRAIT